MAMFGELAWKLEVGARIVRWDGDGRPEAVGPEAFKMLLMAACGEGRDG